MASNGAAPRVRRPRAPLDAHGDRGRARGRPSQSPPPLHAAAAGREPRPHSAGLPRRPRRESTDRRQLGGRRSPRATRRSPKAPSAATSSSWRRRGRRSRRQGQGGHVAPRQDVARDGRSFAQPWNDKRAPARKRPRPTSRALEGHVARRAARPLPALDSPSLSARRRRRRLLRYVEEARRGVLIKCPSTMTRRRVDGVEVAYGSRSARVSPSTETLARRRAKSEALSPRRRRRKEEEARVVRRPGRRHAAPQLGPSPPRAGRNRRGVVSQSPPARSLCATYRMRHASTQPGGGGVPSSYCRRRAAARAAAALRPPNSSCPTKALRAVPLASVTASPREVTTNFQDCRVDVQPRIRLRVAAAAL